MFLRTNDHLVTLLKRRFRNGGSKTLACTSNRLPASALQLVCDHARGTASRQRYVQAMDGIEDPPAATLKPESKTKGAWVA